MSACEASSYVGIAVLCLAGWIVVGSWFIAPTEWPFEVFFGARDRTLARLHLSSWPPLLAGLAMLALWPASAPIFRHEALRALAERHRRQDQERP